MKMRLKFRNYKQCTAKYNNWSLNVYIVDWNLPSKMPPWQMKSVRMRARVGSPRLEETANGLRNGMTSSLAMACSSRGAPVKLCSPAPNVDKNEPTRITHSFGQAMLATTNLPPMDAPNLYEINNTTHKWWWCSPFATTITTATATKASTQKIERKLSIIDNIGRTCSYLSRSSRLSTVPANNITHDRYTVLVVRIAQIVPIGMLFCASAKSPERFDPAMIPFVEKWMFNLCSQFLAQHTSTSPIIIFIFSLFPFYLVCQCSTQTCDLYG